MSFHKHKGSVFQTGVWRFLTAILDSLLPRHPDAAFALTISEEDLASRMRPTTLPGASWIHIVWPYHDARVRAIIKAIKFYGEVTLAERIGVLASDYLIELLEEQHSFKGWQNVIITSVPSSPKRERTRGYNQAELIARAIASNCSDATYDPTLLTREDRPSQIHVMRSRRKANITGAFRAGDVSKIKDRFIILIDDVVESGATLTDARRALLEAGARDVIALAMAH